MRNSILVSYCVKTNRLTMDVPFHLNDVIRGFPSKRFDPKSKKWRLPLVKANIHHLSSIKHKYEFTVDITAQSAIDKHEELSKGPVYQPFPDHIYAFKRSKVPYDPMQHQKKMLDLSWNLKASAWFAKMGTGKTFAAIHLACALFQAGLIDAVLIIAPSTLRTTWRKEFEKYATNPVDLRIHETKAKWLKEFYSQNLAPKTMQVLAASVEGLGVSEASYDSVCGFIPGRRVLCICDESSRIKNPDALRTKRAIQIGNSCERSLILNGTPIALGVQDLYSQYEFLDPNIIGCGDYWSYRTRYLTFGGYENKQIIGVQNLEELMTAILPYTCEVGKDVLNLPPKVMMQRYVELTPEQRSIIKLIVKGDNGDPHAPLIKVTNSLEKVLRCRQVVGGWLPKARIELVEIDGDMVEEWHTDLIPFDKNPKMDNLMDFIESHNIGGTKFVIWSTFAHEIEAIYGKIAEKYGNDAVAKYYGPTPKEERSVIEDRYCTDPKLRFLVANVATAGLGLTFISGNDDVMYYYSSTNAYIDRAQSEDRCHRKGQERTVVIVDCIAEKSVDEVIAASISAKMDVEEYIMTRIAKGLTVDDLLLNGTE